ncbi:MAG: tetratricopeptide repeat protein [Planctomycetia bacterium]|nr:tetratricopeptide repeat protein [Planctomycetia bacterium]
MRFSHSVLFHGVACTAFLSSSWTLPTSVLGADAPETTSAKPLGNKAAAEKLPWDDAEPIPTPIAERLQSRDYAAAVAMLDKLAAEPKAPRARLLYAKGRAWHQAGKFDDAIAAFGVVEKEFPTDVWARRARFARAVALAKKGDFASAEVLYRAEAEYLLSHERKQELADVYLSFARKYAKPRDEKSPADQPPPDFGKALQFFSAALELGPKPSLRPEIELQMADCHRLSGNLPEAITRYVKFVKERPSDERIIEARFRLGEAQLAAGNPQEARHAWQDLLALVPADRKPARPEDEDFLAQAAFQIGTTYGMPTPANDDDLALGTTALEAMIERFPDHKLAGKARVALVRSRIVRGRFAEATAAAELFLKDTKRAASDEAADVRNLMGFALRQQKKFVEALAAWRDFLLKHPSDAQWSAVQQRIIETEYLIGWEAFEKKDYVEARKQWNEFLIRYPLDPRSPMILFQFGRAEYLNEKWDAAIEQWRRLVSKYPGHEISSQAQMLIGILFEEKKHDPIMAMAEFVKVTWGSQVGVAQNRIAQLRAKRLTVATERIFRTSETPYIKLDSRNIDKVTVRVYTVDLETYFRKMHLARGIESLDLALIDPDRTFEFTVPEYGEFKPCESRIELKSEDLAKAADAAKPSVVAVTIGSKTLEATTLVIRSDLDMIVKSSRDEVFVFAENMLTGKPWQGARVLVSNGTEVVAEGTTAADGTFRGSYKQLHNAKDVRVFAASDGNTASNVVSLSGVGVGQGLQERGFLYTDRGGYQPGQVVHVRGILRGTADDRYVVLPKKKYRFETYDARNRLIHGAEVVTGDFGTFHTYFTLPSIAAPGDYRIQVCDIDGRAFQGSFRVENYALEPVRLSIDLPRKVYFRGEEITGTIKAEYYYGTPLAGREIRYTFGDGRVESALTDAQGKVAVKYPTRELREHQTLTLSAQLPERNLGASADLLIAVRAFSAAIKLPRDVLTTGESFAVDVSTSSADGKPTGEKLTLKVFEKTTVEGKPGEREVRTLDVATDAKTGIARVTLTLEQAASYALRVEGRDRFSNPVTASRDILVSGDEDTVRLRILADEHYYKAGDEAKFRVHWREAPALALVTFQGVKILDYRLVQLKTGDNILELPLSERFAPNFQLEVNVMTDVRDTAKADLVDAKGRQEVAKKKTRLHVATNEFYVDRALTVKVETKRKAGATGPIAPGETVDVTVSTLDGQGKPVAAEVGLALIDRMNFDRFVGNRSSFGKFFNGVPRTAAMRTTSSIEFDYRPATASINARLLSEQERLEIAEQEKDLRTSLATASQSGGMGGGGGGVMAQQNAQAAESDGLFQNGVNLGSVVQQDNIQNFAFYVGREDEARMAGVGVNSNAGMYQGQTTIVAGTAVNSPAPAAAPYAKPMEAKRKQLQPQSDAKGNALNRESAAKADVDRSGAFDQPISALATELFFDGSQLQDREITVLNGGVLSNLDRAVLSNDAQKKELFESLKRQGALLLLSDGLQETAYWNPAITTDATGKAVITITLPERSTAWKLLAQGVTMDTRVGDAESELIVKSELFGEFALPNIVTDGDKLDVVATIHDDRARTADQPQPAIEVTLKTVIGGKSTEEKRTLEAGPGGTATLRELSFPIAIDLPKPAAAKEAGENKKGSADSPLPTTAEVTLSLTSGGQRHQVSRNVPIRPYGFPVVAVDGGTTTTGTTVWIEQPADMTIERPRLEVVVGPNVDRSLLEIVLGGRRWCDLHERYATPLETSSSDLLAGVALQKMLNTTRDKGTPEAAELDARIRSACGYLASAQNDDGGWSWSGAGGNSNRYASARVVWALSVAKAGGYAFAQETFDKGINYLAAQQAAVADDDLEGKAVVLHALAEAGRGDFAVANRLFRSRGTMAQAGIAYLALALAKMDHVPMAADLLTTFQGREPVAVPAAAPAAAGAAKQIDASGLSTARSGATEVRALYALALLRSGIDVAKQKEAVDWLLSHRAGNRWSPEKATGPAAAVLAEWFAKHRPGGERYKLAVVVNNYEAANLEIDPNGPMQTIEIDAKHLVAGKQRIQLLMTGRGHLAYQCVLGGFVAAEKIKPTARQFYVHRYWEPAPVEFEGKELPRGFDVASGNITSFRNPLTQLPIGRRGRIQIQVARHFPKGNPPDDQLEYLVVREPIPAGCSVVEQSIKGGFERYESLPGELVFYVGNRRYPETISYEIVGTSAGDFRTAPTIVADAYRPEDFNIATGAPLKVLARGRTSIDTYRWSPDELYALGKRNFEKRDWETARKHLLELTAGWSLDPEPYLDSLKMLLDVHLELARPAEIVKYFELVKEKSPNMEISFDKILKVGAAYHTLGEYERSYLVFRATVESSFARDAAVAGFLDAQGEFLRSVDVMRRLLGEYPPEPYAAAAEYALAQQVYGYAPRVAGDAKLRERKLTRLALVAAGERMLDNFLTAHPDDPAADQAAFADANALLEMEQYDRAVAKCLAFVERYPKSEFVDSYWYVVGYSHFAAGRPEAALEICRKVAEMKHVDPSGRETESRNKQRAIYILGQVYHSLGKAAEAIREYTRVADQIPDAKLAIDYFAHRTISLPEVTTIRPQDPAKVVLKFRNVPKCEVKAYRIDLMKFSLLRQNLSAITQINLSGIRPLHEATIELGDGKDYRDREHALLLPIQEEGAYLVVCRGDNLHASGFVLISPLKVEVQEEAGSGEVRATVKNVADDKFVSDIHVKIIGSRDGEFKAGETDLRGVFAAEPISGHSTVIAQAGTNRYAFYRGEVDLLPRPVPNAPPTTAPQQQQQRQAAPGKKAAGKEYLLEELQRGNNMNQQIQIDNLRNNYYNNRDNGVRAKAAF